MRTLLQTYQNYKPVRLCFLDSSYVNRILGEYSGFHHDFMLCTIQNDTISLDTRGLKIAIPDSKLSMIRLRLKIYDEKKQEWSYHINLIIIDFENKLIERFEPVETFELGEIVNDLLRSRFALTLPNFAYQEIPFHPQHDMDEECKDMGLCVAHVIKFAACRLYCNSDTQPTSYYDDNDIYRFCAAVMALY